MCESGRDHPGQVRQPLKVEWSGAEVPLPHHAVEEVSLNRFRAIK